MSGEWNWVGGFRVGTWLVYIKDISYIPWTNVIYNIGNLIACRLHADLHAITHCLQCTECNSIVGTRSLWDCPLALFCVTSQFWFIHHSCDHNARIKARLEVQAKQSTEATLGWDRNGFCIEMPFVDSYILFPCVSFHFAFGSSIISQSNMRNSWSCRKYSLVLVRVNGT